ncbi:MAG: hypothetical protein AAFX58_10760, partial [Pseudomonadota bacterium]
MSLILDALKKSEQRHKRSGMPGIADVKSATPEAKSPRWLWPLVGLLAVNAIVLIWVLLRPDTAQSDTGRSAAPAPLGAPAATAGTPDDELPALPRRTEVRSLSREVAAATPVANDPPPAAVSMAPAAAASPAPAPAPAPAAAVATAAPDLPLFSELRSSGRLNLPELHVDLHVYHADPARR